MRAADEAIGGGARGRDGTTNGTRFIDYRIGGKSYALVELKMVVDWA